MKSYVNEKNNGKIMISSENLAVRFMLDGENIDPEATPAGLDLDDDDQIDCFLAQVGGSFGLSLVQGALITGPSTI